MTIATAQNGGEAAGHLKNINTNMPLKKSQTKSKIIKLHDKGKEISRFC